jgi:hypothetical protein
MGKLENRANEDVLIQLIKSICLPILLNGAEVCALHKAQLRSLDFAVVHVAMKIFKTTNRSLVAECMDEFGWKLPSVTIGTCKLAFAKKFRDVGNLFCRAIIARFG